MKTYDKPPLSEEQLVNRLVERGLTVSDRGRAARYVRHIGYYRLSPYFIPLQIDRESDQFKQDVTFDDILRLYVFDRNLRLLVLDAVERVEVAVRASISNTMSLGAPGGAFWYLETENYEESKCAENQIDLVKNLTNDHKRKSAERKKGAERSDSLHYPDAIDHYISSYDFPETPPSWLVMEMLTIGQLQHLYFRLSPSHKKEIARSLNLTGKILDSWLRSYVRVRNICAHHGRLWNRFLGAYPMVPRSSDIRWLNNRSVFNVSDNNALERKRLYPVLVSLQTVLFTISPHSTWAKRLNQLLDNSSYIPLEALGMSREWNHDGFWQEAFEAAAPSRK